MEPPDAIPPLIHAGRQAIYDSSSTVVAYELLFRAATSATHASRRSAGEMSRVIAAAFADFTLEDLAGSRTCFINVTKDFLIGELPLPFESSQTVLEILDDVEVDDAVVDGVQALAGRGFTIAVGDHAPGDVNRLLPFVTYVKVDARSASLAAEAERRRREYHPHTRLIAGRLETQEQLQRTADLGFGLFQGPVLGRPHVVSMVGLSPAGLSRLRLVSALAVADVDFDEVVSLIPGDPALTYRLLQATNAAASGLRARVSSVREAAVLLGLPKIRQWVTVMLLSDMTEATEDQLTATMTRARLCQTVAERLGLSGDAAFCMGLLSGIAELIGQSPAELVRQLPLSDEVGAALAEGSGRLGGLLAVVREYEHVKPAGLAKLSAPNSAAGAYLAAMSWCNRVMGATGASK